MCTDMCRGLEITGHSESCPGPGSRVSEHCEGPGNTGHSPATACHREYPPRFPAFLCDLRDPELLTKICLCLGWTVAEMGQRILMGILLSSGTISITQTFYYDQRCDMFHIGEGTLLKQIRKTFNKKDNESIDALKIIVLKLGKIGLQTQISNVKSIKERLFHKHTKRMSNLMKK